VGLRGSSTSWRATFPRVSHVLPILPSFLGRCSPRPTPMPSFEHSQVHGVVFDSDAYTLHVTQNGTAVKGSPLPLHMEEGELDLASCNIALDAAEAGDVRVALG
jgi:hypothetical protein